MFGTVATNLLSLGLQVSSMRYYYREKNNLHYFGSLNFTNFVFIICMFFIGGIVVCFTSDIIVEYIFSDKITREVILLSFLGGCISSLLTYLKQLLIAQQRSKVYCLITVSASIIEPGFAVLFILIYSMTYHARIYGNILSHSVLLIVMLFIQYSFFRLKWSQSALKRSVSFSYAQIPQEMIALLQQSFDRTMLTNMRELNVVGNYHIAQRLGKFSKTFISTIGRAWVPVFMHRAELKTETGRQKIVDGYYQVIVLYNFFCFLLCCFSEEAVSLLTTEAFYPSMYILPLVIFSILFAHTLSAISKPQLAFSEKLIYTLPPSIVALSANVLLNIILIPPFGAMGAVLATLASTIVSSLLLFYFAQKVFPLPIKYQRLCALLMLFILFQIPVYCMMFLNFSRYYALPVKFTIIVLYVYIFIRLDFLNIKTIELLAYKSFQHILCLGSIKS